MPNALQPAVIDHELVNHGEEPVHIHPLGPSDHPAESDQPEGPDGPVHIHPPAPAEDPVHIHPPAPGAGAGPVKANRPAVAIKATLDGNGDLGLSLVE